MNITFWIVAVILMLIAIFLVVFPLFRKRKIQPMESDQLNVQIARQRMSELKAQLKSGVLTQQEYDEQMAELELTLSRDLDLTEGSHQSGSTGRWIAFVLIPGIPLIAIFLYFQFGNFAAVTYQPTEKPKPVIVEQKKTGSIDEMVARLAKRLESQPDDLDGWMMLGRSYKHQKQYRNAADAYAKALALKPEQPEIMLQYADSLAMLNNGRISGEPAELVFKALQYKPDDTTGLWLAGMAKAETGDFSAAMNYWQHLEKLLPAGSDSLEELQALMMKAKLHMDESKYVMEQITIPVALTVHVSVAPEIQEKTNPENVVFIYAKALSGSKMPLAIVRKQVKDLPLTVNLTDELAMAGMRKLSDVDQVKLVARISKSGTAMQQPGDLMGFVNDVSVREKNPVNIIIVNEVK